FQNPSPSPAAKQVTPQEPVYTIQTDLLVDVAEHPIISIPSTNPPETDPMAPDTTAPNSTAPNTPAFITTSTALEIEEDIYLEDEFDEEEIYKNDPDRMKRDLEINERVNRSLAEAEEAVLAREILSPQRGPGKTVKFVERAGSPSPLGGEEEGDLVMTRLIYVWDTFRDFVSVRS